MRLRISIVTLVAALSTGACSVAEGGDGLAPAVSADPTTTAVQSGAAPAGNGGQLVHGFEMEIEERGDSSGHGSGHDGLKIEGPAFGPGETIRIATELAPGVYAIE